LIWVAIYLTVAFILYFGLSEKDRSFWGALFWLPIFLLFGLGSIYSGSDSSDSDEK
jgi:hypothetical protein